MHALLHDLRRRLGVPPAEQPHVIPAGTPVLVRGLQGAAQHNGKTGSVAGYDEGSTRYTVSLEEGESLRIKHDNLLQLVSAGIFA